MSDHPVVTVLEAELKRSKDENIKQSRVIERLRMIINELGIRSDEGYRE